MEEREPIFIQEDDYILKEALVDSDGDTVWEITDTTNNNPFIIHTYKNGQLYITFHKHYLITRQCSTQALRKICEILIERGFNPTINIYYTNRSLISLCFRVGFRKHKKIKHLYYLKRLK